MNGHCLFVYGTLLRGEARGGLLGTLRRRPARTRGILYDLPAGYPALGDGDGEVFGELVEGVSDGLLALLDAYEGVGEGTYQRVRRPVRVDTEVVDAWVYWMADPEDRGGRRIRIGRWRATRRR